MQIVKFIIHENFATIMCFVKLVFLILQPCRRSHLRTASNRFLISLLLADFLILFNCYLTIIQIFIGGAPAFGVKGKDDKSKTCMKCINKTLKHHKPQYRINCLNCRLFNLRIQRVDSGLCRNLVSCVCKF